MMIEKDEEIVKALEDEKEFLLREEKRTGNAPDTQLVYIRGEAVLKILDLIHRLQDDYSNLKERYVKVLDLNEKVIADQKAEIERLKIQKDKERLYKDEFQDKCVALKLENAELQKQVDELREQLLMAKLQGLNEGYNNGVQAERNAQIFKPMIAELPKEITEQIKQQAVKETVNDMGKEIYKRVTDNLKMWLRERFGVEVE